MDKNRESIHTQQEGTLIEMGRKELIAHFMTTLRQNKISNWTYDIKRHAIILQPYSFYAFEHTEKNEILNIPESQIEAGLCHPADEDILRRLYKRMDEGERHVEEKLRFLDSRRKEYRWKKCVYTVIEDEEGNASYAVGSAVDITQQIEARKKYEAAIEYQKYTHTENLILSGHSSLTENRILELRDYSHANLLQRFGDKREAFFLGLESMVLDKEKKEEFHSIFSIESVLRNLELGIYKAELTCEIRLNEESSKLVWVLFHLDVVNVPQTGIIESFLTVHDVTEAHMQEQLVKTVVELDYEYIMVVNIAAGTYRLYTASSAQSMATTPTEGDYDKEIRKYADQFVMPEDWKQAYEEMRIEYIQEKLKNHKVYMAQAKVVKEDGSVSYQRVKCSYLDEEHTSILITRTDITDIMENEEEKRMQLAKALELTEQATQAKTSFLSRISHDIRTPMNTIIGMSALARDEIHNPAAIEDYLHKIDIAGKFLLGLVNDCLDLEKIESNRMTLRVERYTYSDFLNAISTMFIPLCKAKNISFEIKQSGSPFDVIVDHVRFEQIFFNLLSNSVKYTPEGGTILFQFTYKKLHGNMLSCDFEVRDNGIGMSEEFQRKMFDPFEQESNLVVAQSQGSGLGLSIVKNIVDMMGGTIAVSSQEGKGTSTVIHLELQIADGEAADKEEKDEFLPEDILLGRRILLFEDHPLNTEIATKLLKKKGVLVISAENGKEGVDIFSNTGEYYFDAILMDIRMPVMGGYEATANIRALDRGDAKTIPIIAMTANAYEEDVKRCLDAGMNTHLSKPIEPELLYSTLAKHIMKAEDKKTTKDVRGGLQ
jgi:signal transduction histidine kinase/AmiR/NasT family two-component response regulator